jgi:hypothetical protein
VIDFRPLRLPAPGYGDPVLREGLHRLVDWLSLRGKITAMFVIAATVGTGLTASFPDQKLARLKVLEREISGAKALFVVSDVIYKLYGFDGCRRVAYHFCLYSRCAAA